MVRLLGSVVRVCGSTLLEEWEGGRDGEEGVGEWEGGGSVVGEGAWRLEEGEE